MAGQYLTYLCIDFQFSYVTENVKLKNFIPFLILLFQTIKHFMLSIFDKVEKQKFEN